MFLSTQSVIHISPAVWQTAQCETEIFKIYKTVTVLRHIAQIHLNVQYVNTKMHQLETRQVLRLKWSEADVIIILIVNLFVDYFHNLSTSFLDYKMS